MRLEPTQNGNSRGQVHSWRALILISMEFDVQQLLVAMMADLFWACVTALAINPSPFDWTETAICHFERCNFCPLRSWTTHVSSINTHFSSVTLRAPLLASLRTRAGLREDSRDKREQSHTNHTLIIWRWKMVGGGVESRFQNPSSTPLNPGSPGSCCIWNNTVQSTTAKQIWVIIFLLK